MAKKSLIPQLFLVLICFLIGTQNAVSQNVSFEQSSLNFKNFPGISSGSSLKFGPDGRLYVAQLNGEIKILTVFQSDRNQYEVVALESLTGVKSIPNHDDNGQPAFDSRNTRQSTGLTVGGTASNPVIYVTSSDPKWGGPSGDKALDTNSGVITRLTWNGSSWDVVDLVRGLPRSEENHSTNAVRLTTIQGKPFLLVASGGLTNAGSPSKNFAFISEYALSAAVLSVDLNAINSLSVKVDPASGRNYLYDLPTLDDPTRANVNGIYDPNHASYNGIDVNDPFGGNDGLNMAMLIPGGPVQIFSSGYRNAYDLVVTERNQVFVTDNGANVNWGGLPEHEGNATLVNNRYLVNEPGGNASSPSASGEYVDNQDHLLLVTNNLDSYSFGSFYGGHPNPIRANPGQRYASGNPFPFSPGGAGLFTKFVGDDDGWSNITPPYLPNDSFRTQILKPVPPGDPGFSTYASTSLPVNWPPVPPQLANSAEADFRSPTHNNPNGGQPSIVTVFKNNSNGIDEYTASNFNGALKGALVIGRNEGFLHLLTLNPDGSKKNLETDKWNMNGGNALGIDCLGDNEVFPGTIWVATLDNRVMVLTPVDNLFCIGQDEPGFDPLADYDNDGFSNQDEIENQTDPCSGASVPNDYDQDFISDLNDTDDDGDGIPDDQDPFQLGSPQNLPVNNELFSNQLDKDGRQHGYLGLGLTGLMNNGDPNPNWLNWLDVLNEGPSPNDIFGGTAGAIQIALTGGTANGTANSQKKGFQFGVNVSQETGEYIISSGLLNMAAPGQLYNFDGNGEIGIQIGDGTQSNFIKLVLTKSHVTASFEKNDIPNVSVLSVPINVADRPTPTEIVELIFKVSPTEGTVEPMFRFGERSVRSLGKMQPSGVVLDALTKKATPLAVGVFGSSFEEGKEFLGTWDYFRVSGQQPYVLRPLADIERIMDDPNYTLNLEEYFGWNQGAGSLSYTVAGNTNAQIGAMISGNLLTLDFPNDVISSQITIRATNPNGLFIDQSFKVDVVEAEEILLRINAGGAMLAATDGGVDWMANNTSGAFSNGKFSVNVGTAAPNPNFPIEKRHSSVPSYIDGQTYLGLFKSERYNNSSTSMQYEVPLPAGEYTVNLYMGNSYSGTAEAGKRTFDIAIETKTVLTNLDLSAKYGHLGGGMESFKVTVTDGVLNINFNKKVENPLVNGIEIIGRPIQTPIVITNPIPDQTNRVEDPLNSSLVIIASGGDGNLKFSAVGLPKGVSIEPTNGTIYGTVDQDAIANSPYMVTIKVDDSDNVSSDAVSFNFKWTILPQLLEEAWIDKDENEEYTARHETSFVQAGNKFYLMGGRENAKTIDVYDYSSNRWYALANSAPHEFNHFQAVEYQGLIWVIGAFRTNTYPNEIPAENIWMFDPVHEKWLQGPPIPEARRRGSAALVVYNDKLYILGGNTKGHSGGYVNYFDEYNPSTGTWTVLPAMPNARDHFHATVIGNRIYAVSGRHTGGTGGIFTPVIPQVDVFDFSDQLWSTLPVSQNLPTPRAAAAVANFEGKLMVIGGEIANSTAALGITEIYDPVLQKWNQGSPLNYPRHGTQAIVSGNGVFIAAGSPVSGNGRQKNMEVFGVDNPKGNAVVAGSLESSSPVYFNKGEISTINLKAQGGNQAVFVKNIVITGPDAADFVIVSGNRPSMLIKSNTAKDVEIQYVGSKVESNAVLSVEYNHTSKKEISLRGRGQVPEFAAHLNTGGVGNVNYELNEFVGEESSPVYFNTSHRHSNPEASTDPLFQTERNAFNLSYAVPVPNGTYIVRTYHNELYFGKGGPTATAGRRVFDIRLEGALVKDDFDIFVEGGNQPLVLSFENVVVSDGVLNLDMVSSKDRASISGLSIIQSGTSVPTNSAPVAVATPAVSSGTAPLTVKFTGSGSSDDVGVVSYLWDFQDGTTSNVANPSHTFTSAGSYNVRLSVTDAGGLSHTATVLVTVNPPGGGGTGTSLHLNAGSTAAAVYGSNTFVADESHPSYFNTSHRYANTGASTDPLFQTERNAFNLSYAVPVPNGTYIVRTYHNELYFGKGGPTATAGRRVFDIRLEGALVKDDFDIFVEGGNQPLVLSFENVVVSDGVLNLDMVSSKDRASICGLSIINQDSGATLLGESDKKIAYVDPQEENVTLNSADQGIYIYPNPSSTESIISIHKDVPIKHILVHNMAGKLVQEVNLFQGKNEAKGNYIIPLRNLPQGVYLVTVLNDQGLLKQLRLIVRPN